MLTPGGESQMIRGRRTGRADDFWGRGEGGDVVNVV